MGTCFTLQRWSGLLCVIGAVALGPGRAAISQCQYEITAIIETPDCSVCHPAALLINAMNNAGELCGSRANCCASTDSAWRWSGNGGLEFLEFPSGWSNPAANDINEVGQVVGDVAVTDIGMHPYLHDGQDAIDLGYLPGPEWAVAFGINDAGQVVGHSSAVAFMWENGALNNIQDQIPGALSSMAYDISESGAIVGWIRTSIETERTAFVMIDGEVELLGPQPGEFFTEPIAINGRGQVAGWRFAPVKRGEEESVHPFIWSDGVLTPIALPDGFVDGRTTDLNDSGLLVGKLEGGSDDYGFMWDGEVWLLNDLVVDRKGLHFDDARAINDLGQIACRARYPNGPTVAIILDPIRHPSDVTLDCRTDTLDLLYLLAHWGQDDLLADLNADGVVDAIDLLELLAGWTG